MSITSLLQDQQGASTQSFTIFMGNQSFFGHNFSIFSFIIELVSIIYFQISHTKRTLLQFISRSSRVLAAKCANRGRTNDIEYVDPSSFEILLCLSVPKMYGLNRIDYCVVGLHISFTAPAVHRCFRVAVIFNILRMIHPKLLSLLFLPFFLLLLFPSSYQSYGSFVTSYLYKSTATFSCSCGHSCYSQHSNMATIFEGDLRERRRRRSSLVRE